MIARERVQAKYPKAVAEERSGLFHVYVRPQYCVCTRDNQTEQAAWENAAEVLQL